MSAKTRRLALAVMVTAAVAAGAGAAQIAALTGVEPGQWELKEIGGTETKSVCVSDPATLLQIQHEGASCTREIIDSQAKAVTVHYSCKGAGNGRTTLTVRSPRALKVETQGLAAGAPFAVDYDGRWAGECATAIARR